MEEFITQTVFGAAIAAVGALLGGHFAVRRALQQTRGERAFERRLDWYERAVAAVSDQGAALNLIALGVRQKFNEEYQSTLIDEMLSKQPAVESIVAQVQMYATRESALAIAELVSSTTALLRPELNDLHDRSKGFRLDVASMEQAAGYYRIIAGRLAGELRSHLGLEPLGLPSTLWQRLRATSMPAKNA